MRQWIKDLKINDHVSSSFAVVSKSLVNYSPRGNRAGGQYLKLLLRDSTGTIEGRVWDNVNQVSQSFEADDVIWVQGSVTNYNGLQISIQEVRCLGPREVDLTEFQPSRNVDRSLLWERLEEALTGVQREPLVKLLLSFFEDPAFALAFSRAPGGRSVHHAYVGGLLEHTLEVADFCGEMVRFYPELDADLLITGALLHDIGKIKEYDLNSVTFNLTDQGRLLGHVVMGKEMVDSKIVWIEGFPDSLKLELGHMLLSHHGQKEWGAPEVPQTLNALALHQADLLSARINQAASIIRGHEGDKSSWTSWDRLLERSFYVAQPKKVWEEEVNSEAAVSEEPPE